MHMTYRIDYLATLAPATADYFINIANGRQLSATGIGSIKLYETVNGIVRQRELTHVLLLPELKRNLFSIGAINDKDFSYHSYKNRCKIRDTNGKISSIRVRHGKLFRTKDTAKMFDIDNFVDDCENDFFYQ